MKKTLIAAAVLAGFAGVAQAASSVTLYGNVDGGLQYSKTVKKAYATDSVTKTTTSKFGITQGALSGNSFGLKGSEDLSNGVSAIFDLKGAFNITNGSLAGELFGKHAYLGLTSDAFGTVTAGYQDDAVGALLSDNALGGHFGLDVDVFGDIAGGSVNPGLVYVTPDLEGAQFALSWQGDLATTKDTAGVKKTRTNNFAVGASYSVDALTVSGGARFLNNKGVSKSHTWVVGGNYDFGAVNVFARIGGQGGKDLAKNTKDPKVLAWSFGLAAPVTSTGAVAFEYQGSKTKNADVKTKEAAFKLGYVESLSKRTSLFGYAGFEKDATKAAGKTTAKNHTTLVGFGLNHSF